MNKVFTIAAAAAVFGIGIEQAHSQAANLQELLNNVEQGTARGQCRA